MGRLKKLKKIRIHREGTHTLAGSLLLILAVNAGLYFGLECKIPFYVVAVISLVVYGILVNFFRCPIRFFNLFHYHNLSVSWGNHDFFSIFLAEQTYRTTEEVH